MISRDGQRALCSHFSVLQASDAAIEAMSGQFLCGRQISITYAYKKDAKGERHGTPAERLLAAQMKAKQTAQSRPHTLFATGPKQQPQEAQPQQPVGNGVPYPPNMPPLPVPYYQAPYPGHMGPGMYPPGMPMPPPMRPGFPPGMPPPPYPGGYPPHGMHMGPGMYPPGMPMRPGFPPGMPPPPGAYGGYPPPGMPPPPPAQ